MKIAAGEAALIFKRLEFPQPVADYLFEVINSHLLAAQSVLWLVAGGSSMNIAVEVASRLSKLEDLSGLSVTLTDERYGDFGHADSNWQQLIDGGFSLPGANLRPVLTGDSLSVTVERYSEFLSAGVANSDYSIALAGLGADGHIFGIKPKSPALNGSKAVVGYEWADYVRITPTFKLIKELDEVVIYAVGREKHRQFYKLEQLVPTVEQPAQLLKSLPKVTIFNDYKGETV